jgi:hypothetical protein
MKRGLAQREQGHHSTKDRRRYDELLNRPLGRTEGPSSLIVAASEPCVASGVSGMARRRSDTVDDVAIDVASPTPASSLEETGMASTNGVGPAATTSAAEAPCPVGPLRMA